MRQWAIAQGKGSFPASQLTAEEAADTVDHVGEDESDECMGDAAAASPLKFAKYQALQFRINNSQEADSIRILILEEYSPESN